MTHAPDLASSSRGSGTLPSMPERILVVDDDVATLEGCAAVLRTAGYVALTAGSGEEAERVLVNSAVDALVADLRLPAVGGLALLKTAKQVDPNVVVVLITGFPTVETAVEAMKFGASEYLVKPFSSVQLLDVVRAGLNKLKVKETHGLVCGQLHYSPPPGGIVGRGPRLRRLLDDIGNAVSVDVPVLILGESGVGKELVAHAVHADSRRGKKPFVAINCAAIPEHLLEAELFGYERGAFTGAVAAKEGLLETAHGGVVFLDELCELPAHLQAKLLRAVEERTVRRLAGRKPIAYDVRFIGATNRDVRREVAEGRFRQDLFFRLDVIEIDVPSLRDRREDIPLMAAHFLEACARDTGKEIDGITADAMDLLTRYDWPGNVRELKNAVERAVAYARAPLIAPTDLPPAVLAGADRQPPAGYHQWKEMTLERLEREFVERTLEEHSGNVTRAAQALDIHRSTLQRLMRRLKLPAP